MKIRPARHLTALLLTAALVACGDDDPAGPGSPFEQTVTGSIEAFGTNEHAFTAPRSGAMTVHLTWDDADIDLDLYLTEGDCDGYPPNDCTMLAISEAVTGTSETVTRAVTSGADFKIWVDNFHMDLGTDYTIEITIE